MTRRESSNVGSENNGMERALKWAGRKSLQGLCFLLQVDFQFSELNDFKIKNSFWGLGLWCAWRAGLYHHYLVWLHLVAHARNPSIWMEEAQGSEIQNYLWLHCEFEAASWNFNLLFILGHNGFLFIYLLCIGILPTYMSVWGCQICWNWSHRQLWHVMWVMRIEPTSSGRASSASNLWAIFLAPYKTFWGDLKPQS